jgi:predicted DNA-binding WGR domain protein
MTERLLHRIDPSRNMARFYALAIQPTLFGEISLLRAWGRIGTRGRRLVETYTDSEAAAAAFARMEKRKRRRGYRDPA